MKNIAETTHLSTAPPKNGGSFMLYLDVQDEWTLKVKYGIIYECSRKH
jgi:hypothetical protein